MKPFDEYPGDGKTLLPKLGRANTRREDAPRLMRLTGQTCCAYCGISLLDDYYHWLLTSIDHVIPVGELKRLGIPEDWHHSYTNTVLCCSGCNGMDNRYQISWRVETNDWTLDRFVKLRDRVFEERKERLRACRVEEQRFFASRPWEPPAK